MSPVTSGGRTGPQRLPAGMQQITFALERDDDQRFDKWITIKVGRNQTIAQVAARRGHPEDARTIADRNKVRSINYVLWIAKPPKGRQQVKDLKVPGELRSSLSFNVLAGEDPPKVTAGYAKFSNVDRPERTGLVSFDGYDPIEMDVPIWFEARGERNQRELEDDIDLLERMAGRGNFEGAAVGPPPIIRLSTTDGEGNVVPLIGRNYQTHPQNKSAPLWRVTDISWDDALRTRDGMRYRQKATVTVRQHMQVMMATRSVTKRAKTKKRKKPKKTSTRAKR
jgi:hypothetical protein